MHSMASFAWIIRTVSRLAVLATVVTIIVYFSQSNEVIQVEYTLNDTVIANISCHYVTEGNVLPSAEDITPPPDSIFFHETSCRGSMSSRQACSVESVARLHPERDIYVFFNSPISDFMLRRSSLSILTQFKNVKFARLHTVEYAKGTALDELLANGENTWSIWPIQHTADLLRFITLNKYGGVYLDTDLLVVKPLDALGKNWAARESEDVVNIAAMAFGRDAIGRNITAAILKYIENRLQQALKEDKGTGCDIPHLDPFAKEVLQFDKELPKVVCDGRDWVKCYLHECRVVKEVLETTRDIQCSYSDIIYKSDAKYVIGEPTTVSGDAPYVLTRSDHVKVKCTGTHLNSILPSKWKGYAIGFRNEVSQPPPGGGGPINVLIFGFDSTAKNGFIRRMPKSYRFLTEELSATVLNGYNIVGDGTPAALFPILTGKTELELPDVRRTMNHGTLDTMPFIFYKLKEHGYRTAYFEDMPHIGTFQYRFNGFKHQPADHYLRAFFLEESSKKSRSHSRSAQYCVGDTPRYKLMINITEQFFKLPGSHFGFTFIADITHDDFNMISTADDDTLRFLQTFKSSGRLDDTLLFVMGDHGPRYEKVRDTLQGKLEERLPLMAIHLPRVLTDKRPGILENLAANADTLTTPHDIHATILDALDLTQYYNLYKIQGADLYRGLSLLEPIPRNRSCSEAGIEPHWCACLTWQNVSQDDPRYVEAANAFVDFINSLTEPHRSLCARRRLAAARGVSRARANARLLAFRGARDRDGYLGDFRAGTARAIDNYQIKVSVSPGNGIFEASATYIIKENKFVFDVRDISRVNAYNDEPSCISATHPHLNKYCYCNNYRPAS